MWLVDAPALLLERLGVNAVPHGGVMYPDRKLCLVERVEGGDRKPFFAGAASDTGLSAAGNVRTKDLNTWERLPNLVTLRSPQQRN